MIWHYINEMDWNWIELEGTETPFLIRANHKYLTYLRDAKHLTPDMHAGLYSLTVSTTFLLSDPVPTTWNGCPFSPALSPLYSRPGGKHYSSSLHCWGAHMVHWEREVCEAHNDESDPATGAPGTLFVPASKRPKVLELFNMNKLSYHPETSHMLSLAKTHFWWPTINPDMKVFIAAYATHARN